MRSLGGRHNYFSLRLNLLNIKWIVTITQQMNCNAFVTTAGKQTVILFLGALMTRQANSHVNVEGLGKMWYVGRWHGTKFHNVHCGRWICLLDVGENLDAFLVIPIMNNVL
ncbi:unnamed protein product [Heterosigma akashiwo]